MTRYPTPHDVLTEARTIVAMAGGWTREAMARGRYGHTRRRPYGQDCACFCATGAMFRAWANLTRDETLEPVNSAVVTANRQFYPEQFLGAMKALLEAVPEEFTGRYGRTVEVYNDDLRVDLDDITALFDRALASVNASQRASKKARDPQVTHTALEG